MNYYIEIPSSFGKLGLVWRESNPGPRIQQIFLPTEKIELNQAILESYPDALPGSSSFGEDLGERLQGYLAGEDVQFDLSLINLDRCSDFQAQVLRAEFKIPRGWVSTYGKIARELGFPNSARAVGNALARNPFPIIVPCHRAVCSDGSLGGYQGGLEMKRILLQNERVEICESGKVVFNRVFY